MANNKPTFGIPLLPVEVVSQGSSATNNQDKEMDNTKYWIFGGLIVLGAVAYYIFKAK